MCATYTRSNVIVYEIFRFRTFQYDRKQRESLTGSLYKDERYLNFTRWTAGEQETNLYARQPRWNRLPRFVSFLRAATIRDEIDRAISANSSGSSSLETFYSGERLRR